VATLAAYAPRVQFHLDQRSGLPMYLQIVQQVKEALRLGLLDVGDQLPTVREVVAENAINPNTVAKAYRELERDGLVSATPGRGTFISSTLAADSLEHHETLRQELLAWIAQAKRAGMDDESVLALVSRTLHDVLGRRVA
jgi:GntR family transcriptional regulator